MNKISSFGFLYKMGLFLFALLFLISCQDSATPKKINVALVLLESGQSPAEIDSLTALLLRIPDVHLDKFAIKESSELDDYDILWIHQNDSSANLEELRNPKTLNQIQHFIQQGGNLLLTLKSMDLLYDLGLEEELPSQTIAFAKDDGYGRKLGLHAFMEHPVFNQMHGGSYIFSPKTDTLVPQWGYFDEVKRNGKVIAVDWAYIHLHEQKKLMLEYQLGKGKVIGIGACTHFSIPNFNQYELALFIENTLYYLVDDNQGDIHFWNYDSIKVQEQQVKADPIKFWEAEKWPNEKEELQFEQKATDQFWDLAGERILLMGSENGGIEEIWTHPFMALRDYEIGFRKTDHDSIHWLDKQASQIKITPSAIYREYEIEEEKLFENITADPENPMAAIQYHWTGTDEIQLFIRFTSRLRIMWPYSSRVTGNLNYSWNTNLKAFVIRDKSEEMICLVGANRKPMKTESGQFSKFEIVDHQIKGNKTNDFLVSGIMQFEMKNDQPLDIMIMGSDDGLENTIQKYAQSAESSIKVKERAQKHFADLLDKALLIESPDSIFNLAYRWAVVGSDRFFVHTPKIGKSLVAGYATTAKGWDGNHKVNGRPGYAWYFGRDGEWSGFALNDYGDFDKVKAILQQYMDFQKYNGKIYHELTTSGVVHYDAADATPLFVVLAGDYLKHSGDVEFIKKNWSHIKLAMDYCFSTDLDQDHLINNTLVGHGWVEGGHLFGGQSTLYLASTWAAALEEASQMAKIVNEKALEKSYAEESKLVKYIINEKFWNEKTEHFNHSINADGSFIEDVTIMPAIPLYFQQIDQKYQNSLLTKFSGNHFSSDWGVRITGMDSPHFNPKGYHTGSVWPLYTGWVALAEYKNNSPLAGFTHTVNNLWVYHDWSKGNIEEVIHGLEYKPFGVCAHQCWSETMALQPLIEGMLGFEPNAMEHSLKLAPAFPADWDSVKVRQIRVGQDLISMKMERNDKECVYRFVKSNTNDEISLQFEPTFEMGTEIHSVSVNGKSVLFSLENKNGRVGIQLEAAISDNCEIKFEYERGVDIIPPFYQPKPNEISSGIKIISSEWEKDQLVIHVEGLQGTCKKLKLTTGVYSLANIQGVVMDQKPGYLEIECCFEKDAIHFQKYKYQDIKIEFIQK